MADNKDDDNKNKNVIVIERKVQRLKWLGYFYTCWAAIYWIWAIVNTVAIFSNGFDFGCLSFLTVLLTMIVLFRYVIPKVQADEKVSPYVLLLFPIAQCLVVINYGILAIVLMKNPNTHGFLYVSSFAILWFISSIVSYILLLKYTKNNQIDEHLTLLS